VGSGMRCRRASVAGVELRMDERYLRSRIWHGAKEAACASVISVGAASRRAVRAKRPGNRASVYIYLRAYMLQFYDESGTRLGIFNKNMN
jgi:hypothetical protein